MRKKLLLAAFALFQVISYGQQADLPVGFTDQEWEAVLHGNVTIETSRGIESPPPGNYIRAAAEWEEIQALTIAWTSYPGILKQIVAAARLETRVIILTENAGETEDYLMSNNIGGAAFTDMNNVTLLDGNFDSIWMRDYAANPVYGNEVDDLVLVDWIYNRPTRPNDDASPELIGAELGLDVHTITQAPNDLVNTGGNWMSDGFGTAFASKLILEENEINNPYGVTAKTEEEIDQIAQDYLGINRYIKMDALPYDGINHIDMHMKLLDEETILVGEYPDGIADGPQINANIEYVLSNYNSKWGTPYKIIRIPMPDSQGGLWPSSTPTAAYYRTYTNAVFVNKTVILPTYREQYDTTAMRIWHEALPGFNIVGIDSDNQDEPIISASGAIHCITHSVGVEDPMLISHQPLPDTDNTITPYEVVAYIRHRSGIDNAQLYWKTDLNASYNEVQMVSIGDNNWQGYIPAQPEGTIVYYYIQGESVSGKVQVRPIAAPDAYWKFKIGQVELSVWPELGFEYGKVFPNPASAITCIPLTCARPTQGEITIVNSLGQTILNVYSGNMPMGEKRYFFDASQLSEGVYFIHVKAATGSASYPLVVQPK